MFVNRSASNPIITPNMVKPSMDGFKVDCTFNAGVIEINGETLMLLRVAESMPSNAENTINVPVLVNLDDSWHVEIKTFDKNDQKDQYIFLYPLDTHHEKAALYILLLAL